MPKAQCPNYHNHPGTKLKFIGKYHAEWDGEQGIKRTYQPGHYNLICGLCKANVTYCISRAPKWVRDIADEL